MTAAGDFDFATRCPRLHRAHRARRTELEAQRAERLAVMAELVALDRLVAHRELQQLRAATRNHRYFMRRTAKLEAARRDRERVRDRARRLGIA